MTSQAHNFLSTLASMPMDKASPHLTNDQIVALLDGTLPSEDHEACEQHLSHCEECANLLDQLEAAEAEPVAPLSFPVITPNFEAIQHKSRASQEARESNHLALAAAGEAPAPESFPLKDMLSGFNGRATGDGCAPSISSILRLSCVAPETPRPSSIPLSVLAHWPTGQTIPFGVQFREGAWRTELIVPLPWPQTYEMLQQGEIHLLAVGSDHVVPIYSETHDFIDDALASLQSDTIAELPQHIDWQKNRPLLDDLRAEAANGSPRKSIATVTPRVIFIEEAGQGADRFGQLQMELVAAADGAGGELYPSHRMTGVLTDAAWDGALTAAFYHAKRCGFAIPDRHDARWTVQLLEAGQAWDDNSKPQPIALKPGDHLTGRSAGAAFFLGLFALAQTRPEKGTWIAKEVVHSIITLAALPSAADEHTRLESLGGQEHRKVAALQALPKRKDAIVIFPGTSATDHDPQHGKRVDVLTVDDFVKLLQDRLITTKAKEDAHSKLILAQEASQEGKSHAEIWKILEDALELAKSSKDEQAEVEVLCAMVIWCSDRRNKRDKSTLIEAAEKKVAALKSPAAKVIFHRAKASAFHQQRDKASEEAALLDAIRICQTETDDEKNNLAIQACVVRSELVHLLCSQKRFDEAKPLLDACLDYARQHPTGEDGQLMQAALLAAIHFAAASGDHESAKAYVSEQAAFGRTSTRLANRIGSDLIDTANNASHDKAHDLAIFAAQAALELIPYLSEDKQRSYRVGALYTEAMTLGMSRQNDELALLKAQTLCDACNHPDDHDIKGAALTLLGELRRCNGDSQTAVDLARQVLQVGLGDNRPENVGFSKMALARALNDNGQTEEALKEAREAWSMLQQEQLPDEAKADTLMHVVKYAALCGKREVCDEALAEISKLPDSSKFIADRKEEAKAQAEAFSKLRERFISFRDEPNPAALAGTESSSSFTSANAEVIKPLIDMWQDFSDQNDALAGMYDFWGRGNLSRYFLNSKAFGNHAFNITLEVRSLADVKRAVRTWCLYADLLVLLWKGDSGTGLVICPFPTDHEGPGGWGYLLAAGDRITRQGSKREWVPAITQAALLPPDVIQYLSTEALPFLRSGRLIVVPSLGVGCVSPGHGPLEQLFTETLNAIPGVRAKRLQASPLGLIPYSPDAPLEVLADFVESEEPRLRKLRLALLKRSRELRPDLDLTTQAKEFELEIDDALRDLAEVHEALARRRGTHVQKEAVGGTTTSFRSDHRTLIDVSVTSPFAPLFVLQGLGYGWRVDKNEVFEVPSRFEPGPDDPIGPWLAPPERGWAIPRVRRIQS